MNILLLGETSVGKSTLINCLANFHQNQTITYAEQHTFFPIPVCITNLDSDTYLESTTPTHPDDNEDFSIPEGNITQRPKIHRLVILSAPVNIVDTPGFNDNNTVSESRNDNALIDILARISNLHAICVVVKADESRLTSNLEYSLIKIFSSIPEVTRNNVIFCFTHSRQTHFRPARTINILRQLFADHAVELAITNLTAFCFDNAPIDYLAKKQMSLVTDDVEKEATECWTKIAQTTELFLSAVQSLPAFSTFGIIYISAAKFNLAIAARLTSKLIKREIRHATEIKKHTDAQINDVIEYSWGEMATPITSTPFVANRATVCTSSKCLQTINGIKYYQQICDEECRLARLMWCPMYFCSVFDWYGYCKKCSCNSSAHTWVSDGMVVNVIETESDVGRGEHHAVIASDADLHSNCNEIEDSTIALESENDSLIQVCAKIAIFVERSALLKKGFIDVFQTSLDKEIKVAAQIPENDEAWYIKLCEVRQKYDSLKHSYKDILIPPSEAAKLIRNLCTYGKDGYEFMEVPSL